MLPKKILSVLTGLALGVSLGWMVAAQEAHAQEAKKQEWKDRAEYDMADAANKAADAKARLPLIEKWEKGYPQSDFSDLRQDLYLITYSQLGDCRKAFDKSLEILKSRPNQERANAVVLSCLTVLTPAQPADLDNAEKVAQYVLQNIDTIYSDANKGGGFAMTKDATKNTALRTLGWIPFTRKEWPQAETGLTKALQSDSTQAAVSNWLGTSLVSQNKETPAKYPLGLYHFARAATYDGPNSLPAAARKPILDFVTKAYAGYHGSNDGLDKLLATAKANAFPPTDWAGIKSTVELAKEAQEKEQEFIKNNPMIALWTKTLKEPLTAENGDGFFESNVKDAALPGGVNGVDKFKGKIVSMEPATKPKEIILAIQNPAGDATLKFEEALPGMMEAGEELEFSGVAKSFTKDPFMLTFEVDKDNLVGWTGKNAAPVRRPAPAKAKAKSK